MRGGAPRVQISGKRSVRRDVISEWMLHRRLFARLSGCQFVNKGYRGRRFALWIPFYSPRLAFSGSSVLFFTICVLFFGSGVLFSGGVLILGNSVSYSRNSVSY